MAPDYDHLVLMQKVEVFEYALETTTGDDLAKILWYKSPSSEVRNWFTSAQNKHTIMSLSPEFQMLTFASTLLCEILGEIRRFLILPTSHYSGSLWINVKEFWTRSRLTVAFLF